MHNYKPYILSVAITQKCNFNCRYCFTTKDQNSRAETINLKDYCTLLDEAIELGITQVIFYGGEPLMHPDIIDIIKATYGRGLIIRCIFTNGSLISDEILDTILLYKSYIKYLPEFHISFDGFGNMHNEFSQTETEQLVLQNIDKVKKLGFYVKVHLVLCQTNEPFLKDTISYMDDSEIDAMRVLKLMPSPKWLTYKKNTEYKTDKEWYDLTLKYVEWYSENEHNMNLEFWNTVTMYPKDKRLRILPVKGCKNFNDDIDLACPLYETTISVDGNGYLLPCHQMGGIMSFEGVQYKNAIKDGLKNALADETFNKHIMMTTGEKRKRFKECIDCKYWEWCVGGCPLYGWRWRKDTSDEFPVYLDISKCVFFKNNYISKIKESLNDNWDIDKGDFPWD